MRGGGFVRGRDRCDDRHGRGRYCGFKGVDFRNQPSFGRFES
jgi:hypothetical protein